MYFDDIRIIWKLLRTFIWWYDITEDSRCLIHPHSYREELWRDPKWFKTLVMHFPSQLYSLIFTGFVGASAVALQTNRPNSFHSFRSKRRLLTPVCVLADKSGIPSWILHAKGRPREIGLFTGAMSFRHTHKSNLFLPDRLINLLLLCIMTGISLEDNTMNDLHIHTYVEEKHHSVYSINCSFIQCGSVKWSILKVLYSKTYNAG